MISSSSSSMNSCLLTKLQAEIYRQQDRNTEAAWLLKQYLGHRPEDEEAVEMYDALKGEDELVIDEPPRPVEASTLEESALKEESSFEIEGTVEGKRRVATPTLAEVYFNQGLIQDAINVYEKVVAENPDDERSKERLIELQSTLKSELAAPIETVDRKREGKEKLLAVLEAWRESIRELPSKTL